MSTIVKITLLINLITILALSAGLFNKFDNPKVKANYGYLLAGSIITYLLSLTLVIIWDIFFNQNFQTILLLIFVLSPFIIGKLVKYETLKKYTIIQILCFILSFMVLFINFM